MVEACGSSIELVDERRDPGILRTLGRHAVGVCEHGGAILGDGEVEGLASALPEVAVRRFLHEGFQAPPLPWLRPG